MLINSAGQEFGQNIKWTACSCFTMAEAMPRRDLAWLELNHLEASAVNVQ